MTQKDLAEIVAKAWNTLDAKLIESYLSDDFYYESVWVLETMHGKGAYMDYLTGKFDAIRRTNSIVVAKAMFQAPIGEYVIAIEQDGIHDAAIQIWEQSGLITHMWMRPIGLVPGR